jgi:hypothetical protein
MKAKMMPTRDDAKPVYANLDKLTTDSLSFQLLGQIHYLKPVNVEEFYKYVNALVVFQDVSNKEDVTADEVAECFLQVFSSICDTITLDMVKKMNEMQIGALFALLKDHAYGVSHNLTQEELKKKTRARFKT